MTTKKMMMRSLLVFSLLLPCAIAAPAIVWSSGTSEQQSVVNSQSVPAARLLSDLLSSSAADARNVVFLLGRNPEDGSESLSKLAASNSLPQVSAHYEQAAAHYTHVAQMDAASSLLRAARKEGRRAVQVSLQEFSAALEQPEATTTKRGRAMSEANLWVVHLDASVAPSDVDGVVTKAIQHDSLHHVVLAAQRSVEEVKMEREVFTRRRMQTIQSGARRLYGSLTSRRLEDVDQGNNNNNNNDDMQGVYFVHMTPNILAGILFTFLFAFVTSLAISCMGSIAGQDVFVSKMPGVGREV
jgi:hypothetical protein